MRELLKQQIEGKRLPMSMAHRGGTWHGPENSSTAIKSSLAFHPDILELDIRESLDHVLFCFHGSNIWEFFLFLIVGFLPFKIVQRLIKRIETLEQILETTANIDQNIIIYLDLKSASITGGDLKNTLNKFNFKKIWIAAYSLRRLKKLRESLGDQYIYIFNRPALFFKRAIKNCSGIVDVMTFYPRQWRQKNINIAKEHQIEAVLFNLSPVYKKFETAAKYNSLWFVYEDLTAVFWKKIDG